MSEEKHPCPHCEWTGISPKQLEQHLYWAHFTCPKCGKVCEHEEYEEANGLECWECRKETNKEN
jgi:transcription elongation factor Elf1